LLTSNRVSWVLAESSILAASKNSVFNSHKTCTGCAQSMHRFAAHLRGTFWVEVIPTGAGMTKFKRSALVAALGDIVLGCKSCTVGHDQWLNHVTVTRTEIRDQ